MRQRRLLATAIIAAAVVAWFAPFTSTTTCSIFKPWQAQVVGARTQRFKTGPAYVTTSANEAIDPFPDDRSAVSVEVQLVRPD